MTLRLRSEDTSFLQITTATNLADYLQNIGLPPVCRDKGVLEGRLATKIVLLENLFSLVNNLAVPNSAYLLGEQNVMRAQRNIPAETWLVVWLSCNYECGSVGTCVGVGVGEGDVTGCEVAVWLREDRGALLAVQSGHSPVPAYRSPHTTTTTTNISPGSSNSLTIFQLSYFSRGNNISNQPKSPR